MVCAVCHSVQPRLRFKIALGDRTSSGFWHLFKNVLRTSDSNAIIFVQHYLSLENIIPNINLQVNPHTYLKDPQTSDLGRRILRGSIDLMDGIGLEDFTFRKLAKAIGTTEASVYRYFSSKHKLLLYLTSWYWAWTEYRLVFELANVASAQERLLRSIGLLTREITEDGSFDHIDEIKLNRIVICDSSKAYMHRDVDQENKEGVFAGYKKVVARVSSIVHEINPGYKYPHMLISSVIEGAHHQRYFAEHLPKLTDVLPGEDAITSCFVDVVFKSIAS